METTNLDYVNSLARDDDSFKNLLIDVIKNEFPVEQKEYFESCKNNDYKKIEESVHKIKHKISILGLEKSYKIASKLFKILNGTRFNAKVIFFTT